MKKVKILENNNEQIKLALHSMIAQKKYLKQEIEEIEEEIEYFSTDLKQIDNVKNIELAFDLLKDTRSGRIILEKKISYLKNFDIKKIKNGKNNTSRTSSTSHRIKTKNRYEKSTSDEFKKNQRN